jgi:aspartyl-tRNA synthetase
MRASISMNTLPRRIAKAPPPLKESYLGISNYIRGQRRPTSLCRFALDQRRCSSQCAHIRTRAFSHSVRLEATEQRVSKLAKTSIVKLPKTKDASPVPTEEDLGPYQEQHFEEVDPLNWEKSQEGPGIQGQNNGNTAASITQDVLETLRLYQERSVTGLSSPCKYDWFSLRELARGDALNNGKFSDEIELHGFITSQRGGKGITFYQLVDPQLRLTLQLIASDPNGEQQTDIMAFKEEAKPKTAPTWAMKTPPGSLDLKPHTPVRVKGRLARRPGSRPKASNNKAKKSPAPQTSEPTVAVTNTKEPASHTTEPTVETVINTEVPGTGATTEQASITGSEKTSPAEATARADTSVAEQHTETVESPSEDVIIAPHFMANINFGLYHKFGNYDAVAPRLDPYVGDVYTLKQIEMHVSSIEPLNSVPEKLIAKVETNFSPEQRHLQLRTDSNLRKNLRTRSLVTSRCHKFLFKQGFDQIETPLLFKSTPEGAREFLVPTRKPGMAYALPQSPQQYKQILMASGIGRYFQFAKCFRDEDMRADRQPEFTQLDIEMSFASRREVMSIVEYLVAAVIWPDAQHRTPFRERWEYEEPFYKWIPPNASRIFPILRYQQAMELYGSDKPDLRFQAEFKRVEHIIPPNLRAMLTSLDDVVLEMVKIPTSHHRDPKRSSKFIGEFLDAPSSAVYLDNPAGAPGVTVFDPTKPMNGLAAFGYEAAAQVEGIFRPIRGDILLIQARPRTKSFTGGSTPLGNLRRDVLNAAVAQKLILKPMHDAFLWVTDFPLFSTVQESEPGQGGSAGLCSTHHPFTAPRTGQDLRKLYTDPLSLIGDHYDLVINGVEVGGGSVRIHDAAMQELVFKDVLKMSPERIEDFRHLLNALAAGCPPHAGFALGFDRLMAVLLGEDSVKDVIAFPKTAAGEDKMVGSPGQFTEEQLSMYHLAVEDSSVAPEAVPLSLKA